MEYSEFKEILKRNKLTVKKFSELAEISYNTCNSWSKRGTVSDWVGSWLNLYAKSQGNIEDDCDEYKQLAKAFQAVISKENSI